MHNIQFQLPPLQRVQLLLQELVAMLRMKQSLWLLRSILVILLFVGLKVVEQGLEIPHIHFPPQQTVLWLLSLLLTLFAIVCQ